MKSFFAGERKPGFTVLVPDDVCLSDRAKGVLPGRGSRKQYLHFYRVVSDRIRSVKEVIEKLKADFFLSKALL